MELVMALKGIPVAADDLVPHLWKNTAYIEGAKHGMMEKHAVAIERAGEAPVFYIRGVSCCINGFQSLLTRGSRDAVDELIAEVVYPSRIRKYKE